MRRAHFYGIGRCQLAGTEDPSPKHPVSNVFGCHRVYFNNVRTRIIVIYLKQRQKYYNIVVL